MECSDRFLFSVSWGAIGWRTMTKFYGQYRSCFGWFMFNSQVIEHKFTNNQCYLSRTNRQIFGLHMANSSQTMLYKSNQRSSYGQSYKVIALLVVVLYCRFCLWFRWFAVICSYFIFFFFFFLGGGGGVGVSSSCFILT